jgi:hypothetical protein
MGGKRKKVPDLKNKRLDLFLTDLQIEQDKKLAIINYVEKLTFEAIKEKSKPQLRLEK